MAKTTNVDRNIDQRDVHEFRPRLQVTARPVDTFVTPVANNKATRLAQSLGILQQGLGAVGQLKGLQNQKAEQEGHEAFLRGDETPEQVEGIKKWVTSQNLKRESFLAIKGQADVVKMVPDLEAIVASTSSTAEAKQALLELREEHIAGAGGSNGYLSTFVPDFDSKASKVLSQVGAKERLAGAKTLQDQQVTLITDQLNGIVSAQMPTHETTGRTLTRTELLRDPEAYEEFKGTFDSVSAAKELRGMLTEVQGAFKDAGLSDNSTVSKFFVKEITKTAVDLGLPELLDFTLIEESGVKLSAVMRDDIDLARAAAERREGQMEKITEENKRDYRTGVEETLNHDSMIAINDVRKANLLSGTERVDALEAAQAKLDEITDRATFDELGGWDPAKADFISRHMEAANLIKDKPDPSIIAEGHRLWAEGDLTADWVVTHLSSGALGAQADNFASKANRVTEGAKVTQIRLDQDASDVAFQDSAMTSIAAIDEAGGTPKRYGDIRKRKYTARLADLFKSGKNDPEDLRAMRLEIDAEMSTIIDADVTAAQRALKTEQLAAGQKNVEAGKSGKNLSDDERLQVASQRSDGPIIDVQPTELSDDPPTPETTADPVSAPDEPEAPKAPKKPSTPKPSKPDAGLAISGSKIAERQKIATDFIDTIRGFPRVAIDEIMDAITRDVHKPR